MSHTHSDIKNRIERLRKRIEAAALDSGRNPNDVTFVAVGKTQPVALIRQAIEAGAKVIGENYIQEAREKYDALGDLEANWHFIGHLQTNKAKYAVRMFDLIHSVDSYKLALELDKQASKIGKLQNILVQVNISGEASKWGTARDEAENLVMRIAVLENLHVMGLMTMPPFFDAPEKARPFFSALRDLGKHIVSLGNETFSMEELSMGMTGDFEVAIAEGATLVRIGTAIFGERR
jgi:pyridoxal phosphate enzyme (YggS family)